MEIIKLIKKLIIHSRKNYKDLIDTVNLILKKFKQVLMKLSKVEIIMKIKLKNWIL